MYYPVRIGDFVHIGENSIIQAATIGSSVYIGRNVQIASIIIGLKFCSIILCRKDSPLSRKEPLFVIIA